jgi:hypothetical protein
MELTKKVNMAGVGCICSLNVAGVDSLFSENSVRRVLPSPLADMVLPVGLRGCECGEGCDSPTLKWSKRILKVSRGRKAERTNCIEDQL